MVWFALYNGTHEPQCGIVIRNTLCSDVTWVGCVEHYGIDIKCRKCTKQSPPLRFEPLQQRAITLLPMYMTNVKVVFMNHHIRRRFNMVTRKILKDVCYVRKFKTIFDRGAVVLNKLISSGLCGVRPILDISMSYHLSMNFKIFKCIDGDGWFNCHGSRILHSIDPGDVLDISILHDQYIEYVNMIYSSVRIMKMLIKSITNPAELGYYHKLNESYYNKFSCIVVKYFSKN